MEGRSDTDVTIVRSTCVSVKVVLWESVCVSCCVVGVVRHFVCV